MGRYYTTNTGREGKFGFACQSSGDPGDYFGMREQEPNYITYEVDHDDYDAIKKKVDEAYDKLGVPQEQRVYYEKASSWKMTESEKIEVENESIKLREILNNYAFRLVKRDEIPKYEKEDGARYSPFASDSRDVNMCNIERFPNAFLWVCRVTLGITILSDLDDEEVCILEAEL